MEMQPNEPVWFTDFEAAAEAKRLRKPILLQFERDRCAGCRKLEAMTYRDPGVRAELSEWFVPLRLDILRDRRIRAQYHAVWTPSFYFLDYHGKTYFELPGYLPPEDFRLVMRLGWAALYLPKGKYDDVIACLDEGLKLFPDNPRAANVMLHRGMARYLKTWDHHAFQQEMAERLAPRCRSPRCVCFFHAFTGRSAFATFSAAVVISAGGFCHFFKAWIRRFCQDDRGPWTARGLMHFRAFRWIRKGTHYATDDDPTMQRMMILLLTVLVAAGCTTGRLPYSALSGNPAGPGALLRRPSAPVQIQRLEAPDTLTVDESGVFAALVNLEHMQMPFRCRWDFGDGTSARSLNARHHFTRPGKYLVTFTVSNDKRTASDSLLVVVLSPTVRRGGHDRTMNSSKRTLSS